VDERLVLAVVAGLVTAQMAWVVLGLAARERARAERVIGMVRGTPRAPLSVRSVFAPPRTLVRLGARLPRPPSAANLTWPRMAPDELRPGWEAAARGLAVVLAVLCLGLAILTPYALAALIAVPRASTLIAVLMLRARERRWRREIDREVTRALDVFVLALEAGLPFERALLAYSDATDTALARELVVTVRELEVGYRRREALERLVGRSGSAGLAATANAVRVAEDFGTPLAHALRALAVDLRSHRRQRLQEAALRAPVTMLLPTAGLIMVPIFAIILGPIVIRVASGTLL